MFNIGDLVNTHGIKGEVKIISNFKFKDVVFNKGTFLYIDDKKYKISSYRKHKIFDMVFLDGVSDINDALLLKGKSVYINKDDFIFPGVLNEDLYGKKVYDRDKYIGNLKEIINNGKHEILVIEKDKKKILVPYVDEFVKLIDENIHLELIEGFIDED